VARKYELKNPPPPEVRQARARKAASARSTVGYHVGKVIDRVDELTPEDRRRLLEALGGTTEP
jgi:hypothetical protein